MSALSKPEIDSFEDTMLMHAKEIDQEIDKLLSKENGFGQALNAAMRYSVLGSGKKFRGFLILKMADLYAVEYDQALRVAAAIEILHSYSLIHDDLPAMDDSDLRRGKASTHKKFDEATAILAGDALLTFCFEILADEKTHQNPEIRAQLILALTKAVGPQGMALGQMMDMEAELKELSFEQMQKLQNLKTGKLIEFSAYAPAIMAGSNLQDIETVKNYGFYLGRAFQIADDILDEEANLNDLGKPIGQDKEKGKQSYISFLGIDKAKEEALLNCQKAVSYLSDFQGNVQHLKDLAYYTIERKK